MNIHGYKILITPDASACMDFISEDLRKLLFDCVDEYIDVTNQAVPGEHYISLGKTDVLKNAHLDIDYPALGDDGFFIKTAGEDILIDGNTDRSVMYGCYDFLEVYFGVRFYTPDCTVKPRSTTEIHQPIDRWEVPAFPVRSYMSGDLFRTACDQDFQARSRTTNPFTPMDERHGRKDWYSGRNITHNFMFYVPYSRYKDTHPEFYYVSPENEEKAVGDDGSGYRQYRTVCLTNGITDDGKLDESMDVSVAKVVIEEMKKDILARPDAKFFSFEQEDVNYGCGCPRCRAMAAKYKRSGVLIRFCNMLADELQAWSDRELNGRKINILTFAYDYTRPAPLKLNEQGEKVPIDETVIPRKNLYIRIAIFQNYYYSVFDRRQPPEVVEEVHDWFNFTPRIFFWGYDLLFDRILRFCPSDRVIQETVQELAKYDIYFVQYEGESKGWQNRMRGYAFNKLFWNPNLDAMQMMKDFRRAYFGEIGAAYVEEFMRLHYEYLDVLMKEKDVRFIFFNNYKEPENMSCEVLEKCEKLMEEAEDRVGKEEPNGYEKIRHLERLADVRATAMFPLMEGYHYYYPEKSEEEYRDYAKRFVACCKTAGIHDYHGDSRWSFDLLIYHDNYKLPY